MSLDWGEGLPGVVEGCREAAHSAERFSGPPDWEAHGQKAQEEAGTQDKGKDRAFRRGPTSRHSHPWVRGSALASHFSSLPRRSEVTSSMMKISICCSRLGAVT